MHSNQLETVSIPSLLSFEMKIEELKKKGEKENTIKVNTIVWENSLLDVKKIAATDFLYDMNDYYDMNNIRR